MQLVALYLITAPGANMIGLFYLPLVIIGHETGLTETEVIGALETLSRMDVAHYDRHQEIVFVPEMAKHQIAEQLRGGDKQRFGIAKEIQPFLRHPFAKNFLSRYWAAFSLEGVEGLQTPSDAPSEGLRRGIDMTSVAPPKPGSGSGTGTGTGTGEKPLQLSEDETGRTEVDPEVPFDPIDPILPSGQVNGHGLARTFGAVRSRQVPGALPWQVPRNTEDKATAIVDAIADDSRTRADVIPSMVLFFKKAQAGEIGVNGKAVSDPSYGFACWCSAFTSLREELGGKRTTTPSAGVRTVVYQKIPALAPGVLPPPRIRP